MNDAAAIVQLSGCTPRPAREDVQVVRVRAFETHAWVACRHDRLERVRRNAYGLGPVLSWDLLDTLMDLPAGLPVPITSLTRPARRRLIAAPPGIARISAGQVTRDLVAAVNPLLAVVTANDWMDGLRRASRFGPYCRRLVVGPDLAGTAAVMSTASELGIGVAVRNGRGCAEVLSEPEQVHGWQPTTAWWRFCEVIYGQTPTPR